MGRQVDGDYAIHGIHHITLVASSAERTARFYLNVLGLHFVKKTVNFDRPDTYHLYFGDRTGSPGTLVTFFEWPDAPPARIGIGSAHHFALTVDSFDALLKWKTWLQHAHCLVAGPYDHHAYQSIAFTDPDGVVVEIATRGPGWERATVSDEPLIPSGQHDLSRETWPEPVRNIAPDMELGALHHISGITSDMERTNAFYDQLLGLHCLLKTVEPGGSQTPRWYWRVEPSGEPGRPGAVITYAAHGDVDPPIQGQVGHGATHHFALQVADDDALMYWRERLRQTGLDVTPVLDRNYFHSIYFTDPDGLIMEMATIPPGFLIDQPEDRLGVDLALPPWLEADRARIETALPPMQVVREPHLT